MKKHLIIILLWLCNSIAHGQSESNQLPESFKHYKYIEFSRQYTDWGIGLYLAPELAKKATAIIDDSNGIYQVEISLKGTEVQIAFSPGDSDDPSFLIESELLKGATQIAADVLFVSTNGNFYSEARSNETYLKHRKYTIQGDSLKEVNQAGYLVDKKCEISIPTKVYESQCNGGQKIATLPKGSEVKILLEGKQESCDLPQFLIATSFGLVGWVGNKEGYMQEPGKPLSCLVYNGD